MTKTYCTVTLDNDMSWLYATSIMHKRGGLQEHESRDYIPGCGYHTVPHGYTEEVVPYTLSHVQRLGETV